MILPAEPETPVSILGRRPRHRERRGCLGNSSPRRNGSIPQVVADAVRRLDAAVEHQEEQQVEHQTPRRCVPV